MFISRKLQPAEQRYATVEREALAVKWAVGALKYYLVDNPFSLVVDHEPLCWMSRMKDHNPRVLRWYLSLLPFRFSIRHCAGKQHVDADYLSRLFEDPVNGEQLGGGECPGACVTAPDLPASRAGQGRSGGAGSSPKLGGVASGDGVNSGRGGQPRPEPRPAHREEALPGLQRGGGAGRGLRRVDSRAAGGGCREDRANKAQGRGACPETRPTPQPGRARPILRAATGPPDGRGPWEMGAGPFGREAGRQIRGRREKGRNQEARGAKR